MIIKQNWYETGTYNIKKIKENEVIKFYNRTTGKDAFWGIKFNDDVNVWATATINENTTDALGEYVSENGNRWIHEHLAEDNIEENFFRNAVYHIAESRCAKYEVTQNGTYVFKIRDLAGNETEISTDVTEL